MRVIIAGSRSVQSADAVFDAVRHTGWHVTEVLSGGARGVDQYGEAYAASIKVPCRLFKPDWSLGAKAGPLRNHEMAKNADALIAIWDGKSTGTANMIAWATYENLKVKVFIPMTMEKP